MRQQVFVMFVIFGSLFSSVAKADQVIGIWLRESGTSRIRLAPCGEALCGSLIWLKEPRLDTFNPEKEKRNDPLIGRRVFYSMMPTGQANEWQGNAYNPDDGRVYTGFMRLTGDRLITRGCVTGGLACRTITWIRTD